MRIAPELAVVAIAACGLVAGCATQVSPDDPVYQKIDTLRKEVHQLKQVAGGQGMMNMASQQQQLEQELANLQGQVQDLQHELQQSENRQQLVAKDFDQRLSALEQGVSAAGIQAGTSAKASSAASAAAAPAGAAAPSGKAAPQPPSDYQAYQAAFDKLRAGNYSAAVSGFEAFIKQYPKSRYVSNAWYWMGETHYVNGNYKEAVHDFQQVLTKYADSPKASDSYLKIGYAQYALKDYKDARGTFKAVISRYPGSTAADLAKQRLQQMDAQGQ